MKTNYGRKQIITMLSSLYDFLENTLVALQEGHSAQVYRFRTSSGQDMVIKIREQIEDLQADQYAFHHFKEPNVPIPEVFKINTVGANGYAILQYINGVQADHLSQQKFTDALPSIQKTLGHIYLHDISETYGYGDLDATTGNAPFSSWHERLEAEIEEIGGERLLKDYARLLHLPSVAVPTLLENIARNVSRVSEVRRLLHGDPGFDNMLIKDGQVVAVLDWEQMAYGDWVRDFSRLPQNYDDIYEFAKKFGLEAEYIPERVRVYESMNLLRDIEFAVISGDDGVAGRLRERLGVL